jgi:hypothetical protein
MPSSASGDELIVDSTANMLVIPMPTNASCLRVNVEKKSGRKSCRNARGKCVCSCR